VDTKNVEMMTTDLIRGIIDRLCGTKNYDAAITISTAKKKFRKHGSNSCKNSIQIRKTNKKARISKLT